MKYALSIAALLGVVAFYVAQAHAGNCTTQCQRTYGGGSTCHTFCY
jgi:hypothetical protein